MLSVLPLDKLAMGGMHFSNMKVRLRPTLTRTVDGITASVSKWWAQQNEWFLLSLLNQHRKGAIKQAHPNMVARYTARKPDTVSCAWSCMGILVNVQP